MDRKLVGIPASPGIAVGPVHLLRWEIPEVRHRIIPDDAVPGRDRAASRRARQSQGAADAGSRSRRANGRPAGSRDLRRAARRFSTTTSSSVRVEELIRQNLGAEKAFEIVMFEWSQRFGAPAHPMLRERVGDLKDVEIRVLHAAARPAGPRSGRSAERRERDSRHARPDAEPHGAARSRRRSPASRPTRARARRTSRFSRARSACRRSSACARRRRS